MVFTQNPIVTRVKTPQLGLAILANTNTTNYLTMITAGASGSKVVGILLNSTDTAARSITIAANNGATSFPLTTISVPAGAGNGTVNSVSVFNQNAPGGLNGLLPVDNDGQQYIFLPGANTLQMAAVVQLTNALNVYSLVTYADF
jgi:hypothetical protein